MALGMGGYFWKEENRPKVLDIYIFNLSSGRSMFIRTPDDYRVLIDGGSNPDVIQELTKILPFYSRRIDAIIATNTDGKNVAGLIDVLDRYEVDDVYLPAVTLQSLGLVSASDPTYESLLQEIESQQAIARTIARGNIILLGDEVRADVHFPSKPESFAYSLASSPEVLFTLRYDNTSVTFLGNASHKVQEFLASTSAVSAKSSDSAASSTTSTNVIQTDAAIVSNSALPANISANLMSQLVPKYFIYSRQPQSSSSGGPSLPKSTPSKTSKKKPAKIPPDPFALIPIDHRFNIKETGTIHLVSDGESLVVR